MLRTFGHDRQAQAMIEAALAAGINYFETARAYSGSEAYLGRGLQRPPGQDLSHQQIPRAHL